MNRTNEVDLAVTVWHLMLHRRDADQRTELISWLDSEVDVPARWQAWVEENLDADELERHEDDMLLAALGLTREQVENEVASRE